MIVKRVLSAQIIESYDYRESQQSYTWSFVNQDKVTDDSEPFWAFCYDRLSSRIPPKTTHVPLPQRWPHPPTVDDCAFCYNRRQALQRLFSL
jgi:hypothetical protein